MGISDLYEIILPLGISFFTFTQISFLVDCYHGKVETNPFINYALFVTYFPHLIAGPVLHHREMLSQFKDNALKTLNTRNISIGTTIFTIGFFKKIALADNIMIYVEPHFNVSQHLSLFNAWGGALAYSLQIYFDFSAYSDMAIGISKMFNIALPINFNSPYKAKNIIDFWKRWHISLTNFLREYVYIPLGGNRVGLPREYLNLFCVFTLSGIWHGASSTFFIWGVLHGLFILINKSFTYFKSNYLTAIQIPSSLSALISRMLTLIAVVIGWVFFRAASLNSAIAMIKTMFYLNSGTATLNNTFPFEGWLLIALLTFIAFALPNTQEFMRLTLTYDDQNYKNTGNTLRSWQWRPNIVYAVVFAFILLFCIFNINQKSEFLYFQF